MRSSTTSTSDDKDRISKGYEAVVRDQAVVLARVLQVLRNILPISQRESGFLTSE